MKGLIYMSKKDFFVERLRRIIRNENISSNDSYECLKYLLDNEFGIANDSCFGAYLAALQTKGPTIDEIVGLMNCVMYYDRKELIINRKFKEPLCGIIGSGKDDVKTFNISSISSIVAASAGVKVLKNGSRSEASVAGTTDVFEKLGLNVLQSNKDILEKSINELNFGFCDTEPYFPKMTGQYLGKFFFVHPLSYILPIASGISFDRVVFGLASDETEVTAELLLKLGYDNSMVVSGRDMDGNYFDEISNIGPTKISEIKKGKITTYTVMPSDFNIKLSNKEEIWEGKSVQENADTFIGILSQKIKGAKLDAILLNAGALIYISGMAETINDGISAAYDAIVNGKALEKLNEVITMFKEN